MNLRISKGTAIVVFLLAAGSGYALQPREVIDYLRLNPQLREELTEEKEKALTNLFDKWKVSKWPETNRIPVSFDCKAAILEILPEGVRISQANVRAGSPLQWSWICPVGTEDRVTLEYGQFSDVAAAQMKLLGELLWMHSPRHVHVAVVHQGSSDAAVVATTKGDCYLVFKNLYAKLRINTHGKKREDKHRHYLREFRDTLYALAMSYSRKEEVFGSAMRVEAKKGHLVAGQWSEIVLTIPVHLADHEISITTADDDALVTQKKWVDADGRHHRKVKPLKAGTLFFRVVATGDSGHIVDKLISTEVREHAVDVKEATQ